MRYGYMFSFGATSGTSKLLCGPSQREQSWRRIDLAGTPLYTVSAVFGLGFQRPVLIAYGSKLEI